MIDYIALQRQLQMLELDDDGMQQWLALLPWMKNRFELNSHGDMPRWQKALAALPEQPDPQVILDQDTVAIQAQTAWPEQRQQQLKQSLLQLHPWRKGPFNLFGVQIDTEWRSDWKWSRLIQHIHPLTSRRVLDIGCGSGYHLWRMLGAGAELAIGVEPSLLFNLQFHALNHYIQSDRAFVLPLSGEQIPEYPVFDSVFSMGVLYHRPSPIEHLQRILNLLKPGGQMIVETLIVHNDQAGQQLLCPQDRYAQMRNVWFIPNVELMLCWMQRCGIQNPRVVDITKTTLDEQRQTEWMRFHSLAQFLDPENPALTIEGYPAPVRALFLGEK